MGVHFRDGVGWPVRNPIQEFFGLALELIEVGMLGKCPSG